MTDDDLARWLVKLQARGVQFPVDGDTVRVSGATESEIAVLRAHRDAVRRLLLPESSPSAGLEPVGVATEAEAGATAVPAADTPTEPATEPRRTLKPKPTPEPPDVSLTLREAGETEMVEAMLNRLALRDVLRGHVRPPEPFTLARRRWGRDD